MNKYNSSLEQNISVWSRRLGVDIKNLGSAAAYAQELCGGCAGRHGALTVVLMKPISKLLGRPLKDETTTVAAVATATVIYDTVYKGIAGNTKDMFLKNMSTTALPQLSVFDIISNTDAIVAIIEKGISSRNSDRGTVSVTDTVLHKLKH